MEKLSPYSPHITALVMNEVGINLNATLPYFTARISTINQEYVNAYIEKTQKCLNYLGKDTNALKIELSLNIGELVSMLRNEAKKLRSDLNFVYESDANRLKTIIDRLDLNQSCKARGRDTMFNSITYFNSSIAEFEAEMIEKGVSEANLTELKEMVTQFISQCTSEQSASGPRVVISDEMVTEFNSAYKQTLAIGQYGKDIFRDDSEKARLFAISVIAAKYRVQKRKKKTTPIVTPPIETETNTPDNQTQTNIPNINTGLQQADGSQITVQ